MKVTTYLLISAILKAFYYRGCREKVSRNVAKENYYIVTNRKADDLCKMQLINISKGLDKIT